MQQISNEKYGFIVRFIVLCLNYQKKGFEFTPPLTLQSTHDFFVITKNGGLLPEKYQGA